MAGDLSQGCGANCNCDLKAETMGKVAAEIGRGADALAVLSKAKKFDFGKPPGPSAGALSEMAKSPPGLGTGGAGRLEGNKGPVQGPAAAFTAAPPVNANFRTESPQPIQAKVIATPPQGSSMDAGSRPQGAPVNRTMTPPLQSVANAATGAVKIEAPLPSHGKGGAVSQQGVGPEASPIKASPSESRVGGGVSGHSSTTPSPERSAARGGEAALRPASLETSGGVSRSETKSVVSPADPKREGSSKGTAIGENVRLSQDSPSSSRASPNAGAPLLERKTGYIGWQTDRMTTGSEVARTSVGDRGNSREAVRLNASTPDSRRTVSASARAESSTSAQSSREARKQDVLERESSGSPRGSLPREQGERMSAPRLPESRRVERGVDVGRVSGAPTQGLEKGGVPTKVVGANPSNQGRLVKIGVTTGSSQERGASAAMRSLGGAAPRTTPQNSIQTVRGALGAGFEKAATRAAPSAETTPTRAASNREQVRSQRDSGRSFDKGRTDSRSAESRQGAKEGLRESSGLRGRFRPPVEAVARRSKGGPGINKDRSAVRTKVRESRQRLSSKRETLETRRLSILKRVDKILRRAIPNIRKSGLESHLMQPDLATRVMELLEVEDFPGVSGLRPRRFRYPVRGKGQKRRDIKAEEQKARDLARKDKQKKQAGVERKGIEISAAIGSKLGSKTGAQQKGTSSKNNEPVKRLDIFQSKVDDEDDTDKDALGESFANF